MITEHSINLMAVRVTCAMMGLDDECIGLTGIQPGCGSYQCPFYKPVGCADWIRIEDQDGINLIPPEEYKREEREKCQEYFTF